MAYESKIYVVDMHKSTDIIDGKQMFYGEIIAMFNLCSVPSVSAKMCQYKDTDIFIFADDGNTMILKDRYGDNLKEIPIGDAIRILEDAARNDNYRRFAPCISLLKSFDKSKWGNLTVLHYGY